MYLVDTDVISEARKGAKANKGVRAFFEQAASEEVSLFISVITIGEMRQGVELIRHRGDNTQADLLEHWLDRVTANFADSPVRRRDCARLGTIASATTGEPAR